MPNEKNNERAKTSAARINFILSETISITTLRYASEL